MTGQALLFYGYCEQDYSRERWEALEEAETGRAAVSMDLLKKHLGLKSGYAGSVRYLAIEERCVAESAGTIPLGRLAAITAKRAAEYEERLREYGDAVGLHFARRKPHWWLVGT